MQAAESGNSDHGILVRRLEASGHRSSNIPITWALTRTLVRTIPEFEHSDHVGSQPSSFSEWRVPGPVGPAIPFEMPPNLRAILRPY